MKSLSTKLALCAALAAVLSTGCSNTPPAQGNAKIGIKLSSALQATSIAKMVLTVGPGTGTPSFAPIVVNMTNQDATASLTWTGYVQGIPAGTGRTFQVQAFDGASPPNLLYSGNATSTIVAGSTADIFIVLQQVNPGGGFTNHLPIIESLSSSANIVDVGTTASLSVTAISPDVPPLALSYNWTATCGTIANPTTTTPTWTAPAAVPTGGACTISVTVTDTDSGSVTAYLAIQVIVPNTGNAQVNAYPNSWPIISGIVAAETFTKNAAGQIVAIDVDLTASATDPDGDDLKYSWTSPDCVGPTTGYTDASVTTPAATISTGPGQIATNTVHFHSSDPSHGCTLQLDVTDYWKNGIVPVGSGLPVARGGDTQGFIYASTPTDFALAPQITGFTQPNAGDQVQPEQTVTVGVTFIDPTPSFNTAQTPFTIAWTQTGGAFVAGSEVDVTSSPGSSNIQWTAPNPLVSGMSATVVVTNKGGLTATQTFMFVPANSCSLPGSNGTACDTGLGACAPNGACQNGACVSPTPVVCTAEDQCHSVGVCNPATGTCSNPQLPTGTTCNPGNLCITNATCSAAGVCGGTPTVCVAIDSCHTAGTCDSTTGVCSNPTVADGTSCTTSNLCQTGQTCTAGVCGGGTPVTCTATQCATGGTCSPATGTCTGGTNQPNGTPCTTGNPCDATASCESGVCVGNGCPPGETCTGGVCTTPPPTVPTPEFGKDLQIGNQPTRVAIDATGDSYVVGSIFSLTPISFDGINVASTGDADLLLVKYNYTTGTAIWAEGIGDSTGGDTPQNGTGAAITNNGVLAALGNFMGSMTIGANTVSNSGATNIDFLAGLNASTGAGQWVHSFNDGTNGALLSVHANPNLASSNIVVCGKASAAATDLVPGAVYGGGLTDIIIGVFSSTGTRIWSAEIGTANEEECDAVAIDDNGDVYAAGKFDGASLTFPGTTPIVLTGPGTSTRQFLWVAKFAGAGNGSGGANTLEAVAYSGAGGATAPTSIAVDATDNVIVGGNFTGLLTFPTVPTATALTSAGSTDAFVASLGAALAPTWAVRLGGTAADSANSVAVSSVGDVLVTGGFRSTTTGAATLTAAGSLGAPDVFILKLAKATGATQFSAGYGDPAGQSGDSMACNRYGTGTALNQIIEAGTLNSTITFPAPVGTITAAGVTDTFLLFSNLQ